MSESDDVSVAVVDQVSSSWEWAGPSIMVATGVAPWAQDLIDAAESLAQDPESGIRWRQAEVYQDGMTSPQEDRDCETLSVSTSQALRELDGRIHRSVGDTIRHYCSAQRFAMANRDSGYELLRYEGGQKFVTHVDSVPSMLSAGTGGLPGRERQVTMLFFLSDPGTYEGGELVFPDHGVSLRPEQGSVVVFPSNFAYPHEARPTTKGRRYVVATWLFWVPQL